MRKRIIGIFVFLIVVLVVVFWTIKIAGKPQVIATPAPSTQTQTPDLAPTPEPKPVIEVSKAEKPILVVEDPGGRLLVDDWSSFKVVVANPGNKLAIDVIVGNLTDGAKIYAPFRGYATNINKGEAVLLLEGEAPKDPKNATARNTLSLYNVILVVPQYVQFDKGEEIGHLAQVDKKLYSEYVDDSFNLLIAPAPGSLQKIKDKGVTPPRDAREYLLFVLTFTPF